MQSFDPSCEFHTKVQDRLPDKTYWEEKLPNGLYAISPTIGSANKVSYKVVHSTVNFVTFSCCISCRFFICLSNINNLLIK